MKKIILIILIIILFIPVIIYGEGYKDGYSDWSEIKTDNYGEIEKTQYGYYEGYYPNPINKKDVILDKDNLEYYKDVYQYEYISYETFETREFSIVDTKAQAGVVWSKYLNGYHLTEIISDIDMANSDSWSNYHQPRVDIYDDSGFLFTSQNYSEDIQKNGKWYGDIVIHGSLYMYTWADNDNGRNWTGAGGNNYIKCYKKTTKTSDWVYSYKDINDLIELIQEKNHGYVEPVWSETKGWRFSEPYENIYNNNPIKAVERKVYSYPLGSRIIYHLNGGEFKEEYPTMHYPGTTTKLVNPSKLGFDFVGWYYDQNLSEGPVYEINDNSKKEIDIFAKYQRKSPTIKVKKDFIEKKERDSIDVEELLYMASAFDELDGDITDKIFIEKIYYVDNDSTQQKPSKLTLGLSKKIIVTYSVYNSGNIKASENIQLYILTEGEQRNKKIYPRYISESFTNTIKNNSRWKDSDYENVLHEYFKKMEE